MQATINHADLLRLSKMLGTKVDDEFASLLGFDVKAEKSLPETNVETVKQPNPPKKEKEKVTPKKTLKKTEQKRINFNYWYTASNEKIEQGVAPILVSQTSSGIRKKRPIVPPYIDTVAAKNHIRHALQHSCYSKKLNIPKAINNIAQNKTHDVMPYKQRQRLPDTVILLLDLSARLEPVAPELEQYLLAATQLFGPSRLRYKPINYAPNINGELIFPNGQVLSDGLQKNTAVLYIGDQGAFSRSARRAKKNWARFWQKLQQANIQTNVIQLATPEQADSKRVEQLMAATMRCEGPQTDRIRDMHLALNPIQNMNKALAEELLVWNHPDHIIPGQIADVSIHHLQKWSRTYSRISQAQKEKVEKRFERWRKSLSPAQAAMEALKGASLNLESISNVEALEKIFAAYKNNEQIIRYASGREALIKYILFRSRDKPELLVALKSLTKALQEENKPNEEINKTLRFKQQGNKLIYSESEAIKSPLFILKTPVFDKKGHSLFSNTKSIHKQTTSSSTIESNTQQLEFKQITKPLWAERIWHDSTGLYAAHADGTIFQQQVSTITGKGIQWVGNHNAWQWASHYGIDQYGLWATLTINQVDFPLRWIPAGEFLMGSPEDEKGRADNETQHKVRLTKGYWLAETSCTQQQWQAVMDENPSESQDLALPVNNISWDDCQIFMKKLTEKVPDFSAQLPSEAQWEYACRAGTSSAYWWGNTYDKSKISHEGLMNEDKLPSNNFGLKSMSGNIYEWCNDYYGDYKSAYKNKVNIDPQGANSGSPRVLRGGDWFGGARYFHSAYRRAGSPDIRARNVGLRLAGGFDPQAGSSVSALTADRHEPSDDRAETRKNNW